MSTDGHGERDIQAEVVAEVGGLVDETHVTLGIYGPDVQPEEISALLNCEPTHAHRRGGVRGEGKPDWEQGAWLLTLKAMAPIGPNDLLQQLLAKLPQDQAVWKGLISRHRLRVSFGIFVVGWSQGFDLPHASLRQLAELGIPVGFSIYADEGADAPAP